MAFRKKVHVIEYVFFHTVFHFKFQKQVHYSKKTFFFFLAILFDHYYSAAQRSKTLENSHFTSTQFFINEKILKFYFVQFSPF